MTNGSRDRGHRARRTTAFLVAALVFMLAALGGLVWLYLSIAGSAPRDPIAVSASGGVEMEPLGTWYGFGTGADGQFKRPHDVNVGPDGDIYVADSGNGRVLRLDPDGTLVGSFGSGEWGAGKLESPTGIAVGEDGRVYVADAAAAGPHGKVLILSPDLSAVDKEVFYAPGDAPIMVRVYGDKLYVTSRTGVHIHDLEGSLLNEWGGIGKAEGQFSYPNGVALLPDGTIVVAESNNRRLQLFDPRGKYLRSIGAPPVSMTDRSGLFGLPMGVAADERGVLYVADAFDFEIKLLGPGGEHFATVGEFGSSVGQFNSPGGIVRAPDGVFFVADELNHRIVSFRVEVPEAVLPEGVWPAPSAGGPDLGGLLSASTCLWLIPVLVLALLTVFVLARRRAAGRALDTDGAEE